MREFNLICKEFEQLDSLSYGVILAKKSAKILPALKNITKDGLTGAAIYSTFILGAIVADGRISEEEYALCYPLLRAFFGEEIDYNDVKKAVKLLKTESTELKRNVDEMVDILGELDDELKDDIVIVCMMICAIDGKISLKEKNWIKQLIK
ncbi:MAG: TerB family tellurite resistance protein [Clostridia bacterium]|nr:TerB family tellurite resistance protein [Clostridia bacterium]